MLESLLGNRTAERVLLYLANYGQGYPREIAATHGSSVSVVLKQLTRLENGGILVSRTLGRTRLYEPSPSPVGKLLPGVPHWKASAVLTWRPTEAVSLTAAARFASRIYGTLNNADFNGNTWQGFDQYFVVDLRARFRVSEHLEMAVGVDNLTNDRYFLFHPFPHRSVTAELRAKL